MPDIKELGLDAGMDIRTVCKSLMATAPATTEFNGVRLTTRAGDTPETLYARWDADRRTQYEDGARERYRARLARVREIISSTISAEEAAVIIVNALHPIERYGD